MASSVAVLLASAALACGKKSAAPLADLHAITRAEVQPDSRDVTYPIRDSSRLTQVATLLRALLTAG